MNLRISQILTLCNQQISPSSSCSIILDCECVSFPPKRVNDCLSRNLWKYLSKSDHEYKYRDPLYFSSVVAGSWRSYLKKKLVTQNLDFVKKFCQGAFLGIIRNDWCGRNKCFQHILTVVVPCRLASSRLIKLYQQQKTFIICTSFYSGVMVWKLSILNEKSFLIY